VSRIDECKMVSLEKFESTRGSLSPLYGGVQIPFPIKRTFYLYDVPGGAERGGHAHRELQQFVVAASGSFKVEIDDGQNRRTVSLDRSYHGLYVPGLIWTQITGFCSGAVCLVFASLAYDESDYIREYQDYLEVVGSPTARGQT
jgi:hypothetical protein